jgi:hypothetical protein
MLAMQARPRSRDPARIRVCDPAQRSAAWRAVRERHGSIGESKVDSLAPAGSVMYEHAKSFVKSITATMIHRLRSKRAKAGLGYLLDPWC